MKLFKSEEERRIEELEKASKKIHDEICRLKKEPIVWIRDYFKNHPNIDLISIDPDVYRNSIVIEIKNGVLYPVLPQEILQGINYVVTEARPNWYTRILRVRLENSDSVRKSIGY